MLAGLDMTPDFRRYYSAPLADVISAGFSLTGWLQMLVLAYFINRVDRAAFVADYKAVRSKDETD